MGLANTLRTFAKSPLIAAIQLNSLRRRIIFELKQNFFDELGITVPLGFGLQCPIWSTESWASFTECFVEKAYLPAFEQMPMPSRWLDLGCHTGFFSLFVIWLRAKKGLSPDFKALLVDGDCRMTKPVETLISINGMRGLVSFHCGLISDKDGFGQFVERSHMASSLSDIRPPGESPGSVTSVETATAAQLLSMLPPPYDLVKVDVEGAEYHFLTAYKPVLDQALYLLIEWHSWHAGGGGSAQIIDLAAIAGFVMILEVVPAQAVQQANSEHQCGVFLFRKK